MATRIGPSWHAREHIREDVINEVNQHSWTIIHHHNESPGLYYGMDKIEEYRERIENLGCTFILATMMREPVTRHLSHFYYTFVEENNLTDWLLAYENFQCYYYLYNFCAFFTERRRNKPPKNNLWNVVIKSIHTT